MNEPRIRLFLALLPDERARTSLASLASAIAADNGGRAVASANIHLTLAFLGDRPASAVTTIDGAAGSLAVSAFGLRLDFIDWWRRNEIVWAGCSAIPAELMSLRGALGLALATRGVHVDDGTFSPHLTLARRVAAPFARRQLAAAIDWPVDEFALVASDLAAAGPRYRVLNKWQLLRGGASADSA